VGLFVIAAVLFAACGSISSQRATSNWLQQSNFSSNTLRLAHDAHVARGLLMQRGSTPAQLHTVCGVLLLDSEAANSALPSPDHQANALLGNAYQTLGDAANTCYKAGSNAMQRARALEFLTRAVTLLTESQIRLRISAGATS
jgi:hypothetical protein